MKKMNWSVMATMLCMVGLGFNQNSQAAPSVGGIVTSAGLPVKTSENVAKPAISPSGSVAIEVIPFIATSLNLTSANWMSAVNQIFHDEAVGTFSTSTNLTSPANYMLANHFIAWWNLIYSSTIVSEWDGVDNPPAPFNNESGNTVQFLIHMHSLTGANNVSLSMLSVTSASLSDGNYLGSSMTFGSSTYTPFAFCKQADGTVVTSGSSSTAGTDVILIYQPKMFNNGGTQAGLNQAMSYIYAPAYTPYILNITAQVVGDGSTASSAWVSTGTVTIPKSLNVSIMPNGVGSKLLSISNGVSNTYYDLWSAPALPATSWQFAGLVNGTNAIPINITGASQMFYRASVQ